VISYQGAPYITATLEDDRPITSTTDLNGRETLFDGGYQRWRTTITFDPMEDGSAEALYAYLVSNRTNVINVPVIQSHRIDKLIPTIRLSGAHAAGRNNVRLSFSGAYKLNPGLVFTIANDKKVYMITSAHSGSSGAATVSIYPRLKKASATNSALSFTPVLNCRFDNRLPLNITYEYNTLYSTLPVIEVLE